MFSIILGSMIILESFLIAEAFKKYESKALSPINVNKRVSDAQLKKLIDIYDRAVEDSWSSDGVIPHPSCRIPFRICVEPLFCSISKGPFNCQKDDGGSYWCSKVYDWKVGLKKYPCYRKGSKYNLADPNKWKAPDECSTLSLVWNSIKGNNYYYRECTKKRFFSEKLEKLKSFSKKPKIFSEKPKVVSKKPVTVSKETEIVSKKPKIFSKKPKIFSKKPKIFSKIKKIFSKKPKIFSKKPKIFSSKPWCSFRKIFRKKQSKNCKANGMWGAWTKYSNCTEDCRDGVKTRTRKCDNPKPQNGGSNCKGDAMETADCNSKKCPIEGKWTEWISWTDCTKTCEEDGYRFRKRECTKPIRAGKFCEGREVEFEECGANDCSGNLAKMSTKSFNGKKKWIFIINIAVGGSILVIGILIVAITIIRQKSNKKEEAKIEENKEVEE